MAADGELTPGELSRRVQELLLQFEALLRKVEDRYVQKDLLELIREGIDAQIKALGAADAALEQTKASSNELQNLRNMIDGKADRAELQGVREDVDELKGHNQWLFRVVGTFIVLGILGAVFVAGGGLAR